MRAFNKVQNHMVVCEKTTGDRWQQYGKKMTRRLSHIRLVTKCETGNIASGVTDQESTDKKTTARIWQKYGRKTTNKR